MKFLVFQHVPHEHPGLINDWAKTKGIDIDVVQFFKKYSIPDLTKYDSLIIMGGPMGVYEPETVFPSKDKEIEIIKRAIDKKIPTIGFCLGSQLIAHALGAQVHPNMLDGQKLKEIGYYDVDLTVEGLADPIFKGFETPIKVLQWHGDAFDLPESATLLATSPRCINQAFRYGNSVYAMLFHNEFTPDMVKKQIEIDNNWIHESFDFNEGEAIKKAVEYKVLMERQCYRLMDNFVDCVI